VAGRTEGAVVSALPTDFFNRPTLTVARELLGQRLVRQVGGRRLSAAIVETEAYIGHGDTACHAGKGRTARTDVMFGPPGRAYVYLIYGMYHMLNLVTEADGFAAAVLIRAVEPLEGVAEMQTRRQKNPDSPVKLTNLTSGPGKLCQALAIDRALNRRPVTTPQELWVEQDTPVAENAVATGPRVGIDYAAPKDRQAPWRFWVKDNRFVSRR